MMVNLDLRNPASNSNQDAKGFGAGLYGQVLSLLQWPRHWKSQNITMLSSHLKSFKRLLTKSGRANRQRKPLADRLNEKLSGRILPVCVARPRGAVEFDGRGTP